MWLVKNLILMICGGLSLCRNLVESSHPNWDEVCHHILDEFIQHDPNWDDLLSHFGCKFQMSNWAKIYVSRGLSLMFLTREILSSIQPCSQLRA